MSDESRVFHLQVRLDNEAFSDGNEGAELSRILRKVADTLENRGGAQWEYKTIFDANGNSCGQYAAKPVSYR